MTLYKSNGGFKIYYLLLLLTIVETRGTLARDRVHFPGDGNGESFREVDHGGEHRPSGCRDVDDEDNTSPNPRSFLRFLLESGGHVVSTEYLFVGLTKSPSKDGDNEK